MSRIKSLALYLVLLAPLAACQSPAALTPAPTRSLQAATAPRFYDTARDAYRWAEIEARGWDFAARLAKVEGSLVDESGRCFEWRYYFTAVGKQKALMVNSRREKREVANIYFGGGMLDLSWRLDSGEALKKAKEKGLKSFPVSMMELDSFVTWDIRSFDGSYRIDAR